MNNTYHRCEQKEAAESLVKKAQQELDTILEFVRKFIPGDYTARAVIIDHGDHCSIAGELVEAGTVTRTFDPVTDLFEEIREQMILHIGRLATEKEKEGRE